MLPSNFKLVSSQKYSFFQLMYNSKKIGQKKCRKKSHMESNVTLTKLVGCYQDLNYWCQLAFLMGVRRWTYLNLKISPGASFWLYMVPIALLGCSIMAWHGHKIFFFLVAKKYYWPRKIFFPQREYMGNIKKKHTKFQNKNQLKNWSFETILK